MDCQVNTSHLFSQYWMKVKGLDFGDQGMNTITLVWFRS